MFQSTNLLVVVALGLVVMLWAAASPDEKPRHGPGPGLKTLAEPVPGLEESDRVAGNEQSGASCIRGPSSSADRAAAAGVGSRRSNGAGGPGRLFNLPQRPQAKP